MVCEITSSFNFHYTVVLAHCYSLANIFTHAVPLFAFICDLLWTERANIFGQYIYLSIQYIYVYTKAYHCQPLSMTRLSSEKKVSETSCTLYPGPLATLATPPEKAEGVYLKNCLIG